MATDQPDLFPADNTARVADRFDSPERETTAPKSDRLGGPERAESHPKPPADEKVVIVDRPDSPDVGVEDLKKQLDALQASQRQEREAREAEARAMAAAQQVYKQRAQIEQAHQAETARVAELARAAAQSTERGEFETAEAARLEQQKHIARQRQLEQAHQYLQRPAPEPEIDWTRPWGNAETEAFLKTRTEPTQAWIKAHPEFARDPEFRDKVTAADSYVTKLRGIERDTPEYFQAVEREIGLRGRNDDDGDDGNAYQPAATRSPTTSASSSTSRSSPAYAAPVSRSAVSTGNQPTANTVRLTPQERELARHLFGGPDYKDQDPDMVYARNKAALIREGRLGPGARDGR